MPAWGRIQALRQEGKYLRAYTNPPSSIVITNVATGFVGLQEPVTLAIRPSETNGWLSLALSAPAGFSYLVQTSTNLTQ